MHPTSNKIIKSGRRDDKSSLWCCDMVVTESMRSSAGMDDKVHVWNAETDGFCVAVKGPVEAVWDQLEIPC
ncbi:hypothetical protein G6F37_009469 [Rhizopus arrhizus]|nr:hypothetical protein G6F38_005171 [Rhizopus arrhizus]KAG1154419.1 hypothetical protein G6F37_009469 [Rhizopus arrhizus]